MMEIHVVADDQYDQTIRQLFSEYLEWLNERLSQEYGISFEVSAKVDQDMLDLGKFMPPSGRLLLGILDHRPAGMACLKSLEEDCGEVKRMYVRPGYRRIGLGRALLERLLTEAALIGYKRVRLDSGRFMVDAQRLYRTFGFQEIEPYEGSEVPPRFQSISVFMQKDIDPYA